MVRPQDLALMEGLTLRKGNEELPIFESGSGGVLQGGIKTNALGLDG
jgi:hypothetical protein